MEKGLRKFVYKCLGLFSRLMTLKYILLESNPPLGDNTGAVFRKMVEEKWHEKYHLIWIVDDSKKIPEFELSNVSFVSKDNILGKLSICYYLCRALAIIDCNAQITKVNEHTFHMYLAHGSPLKSVRKYYYCNETTDFMLSQSPFFHDINTREFHIQPEKLVTLGYPRNDDLFSSSVNMKKIFGESYQYFVAWYPTYRQNNNGFITTSIGIPIIHDEKTARKINSVAAKFDVLLIVKPHPAQDMSYILNLNLSHICFINDDFLRVNGCNSYEFLGASDGLITDYSSVFFDYLLTDKPIGLTLEDIEEYSKHPGFAIDPEMIMECSNIINTPAEFESFLDKVASGDDDFSEKRNRIRKITNTYSDDQSAKRVVDFISDHLFS